ncbi:rho GTPase-activating protein 22-like isoform X1 [Carassius carassius]|uniref:rho GTPase-activating protein 22-like isoform X1 n=1 Tax=Carassius carassius TaxID=217509 RepID=UPI00286867DF|nr:rho GTPase-activating protein 22-like isoform X1 [Carassius carassius]
MNTMLSPKIRQSRRARSKSMVMGELSRGPSRPSSPSLQDRPLKAGWLKKQRNIMKNWQLRWFVLRTDHLYFYKDEEETKPQGCIPLQGSQVNELTANPDEPGRNLFEIVPGCTAEKDRSALSHEAFLLMANSQNDMEDWVKAIRRVIWAPFGGGIFGQHLEDTVQSERKFGPRLAPLLVEQCVDFIREQGLKEEGLFRMPGQANLVKELQDAFDCGDKPLFDSNTDIHTVASLLKLYLRELPEPVIPFNKYEDFLTCAQLLLKDDEVGLSELVNQVNTLPQANYNLLKYICKFLDEVQSHSNENKMSVQNLATVFGPNILRPKVEDPVSMMEGTSQVQHLMTVLISEHERLYVGTEGDASSEQTRSCLQGQRGMAEWISDEELLNCSSPSQTSKVAESVYGSATSLDMNTGAPTTAKMTPQGKAGVTVSPSKQAKSLPSWKYSFKSGGVRAQPVKFGGSSVDVSTLPSTGNWLMNGLSSLRSHRRTSSGERMGKDSVLSHRLSTYDNVSSSSLSVPSVASTPWSTSSCEILVDDSVGSDPSEKVDWSIGGSVQGQSGDRSSGVTKSSKVLEMCVSSAGCSENGSGEDAVNVTGDTDISKTTLNSLVTELKDELKKQKVNYESQIRRLEESSVTMHNQIERLEEELDQGKKKYCMLEIKLRNSERAREDAETRNHLLQNEMEEFFSTLGDLTLGTRTS